MYENMLDPARHRDDKNITQLNIRALHVGPSMFVTLPTLVG